VNVVHGQGPDVDPASIGRELDRVRQQVQQHLLDLPLVAPDLTHSHSADAVPTEARSSTTIKHALPSRASCCHLFAYGSTGLRQSVVAAITDAVSALAAAFGQLVEVRAHTVQRGGFWILRYMVIPWGLAYPATKVANERPTITIQFLFFTLIGATTTATHYVILVSSVNISHASPVAASAFGFGLSALMNYALNYRITFSSNRPHLVTFAKFSTIAAAGLTLNTMVMAVAIGVLRIHYFRAQLTATALVLVWNFIGHRAWTFGAGEKHTQARHPTVVDR
jgi:putative flippase GtrA